MLEGHPGAVKNCGWSPDGTAIASVYYDGTVCFWDTKTYQRVQLLEEWHKELAYTLWFSPDGRCLTSGVIYQTGNFSGSSEVYLPHVNTFDLRRSPLHTEPDDHTERVCNEQIEHLLSILRQHSTAAAAVSPDGKLVLSASDYPVKVRDAFTGDVISSLEGYNTATTVTSARFSPCGQYIASPWDDKMMRLWRTRDGSCMTTFFEHEAEVQHVDFSPDGRTLSSAARDGSVFIRRMADLILDEYSGF